MMERDRSCLAWPRRMALAFSLAMAQATEATAQTAEMGAQNPPAEPRMVLVKKGELIEVAPVAPVSSATAKRGDTIRFRLTGPLVVSGETILPAGWEVTGRVTRAVKAGAHCKNGRLDWVVDVVKSWDGTPIQLTQTSAEHTGPGGKLEEIPDIETSKAWTAVYVVLAPALLAVAIPIGVVGGTSGLVISLFRKGQRCTISGVDETLGTDVNFQFAVKHDVPVAAQPVTEWPLILRRFSL